VNYFTRREALARSMGGLGSVVLSWMLHENPLLAATSAPVNDLLPRAPHFPPKARSVIFLFMPGGPSHVDLLDPKPLLTKFDGKEPPIKVVSRKDVAKPKLFGSPFKFAKHGQSGIDVSELLPGLASVIDEVAVIRSGVTERIDHDTAQYHHMSGRNTTGFPSIGAWGAYGLWDRKSKFARLYRAARRRRPDRSAGLDVGLAAADVSRDAHGARGCSDPGSAAACLADRGVGAERHRYGERAEQAEPPPPSGVVGAGHAYRQL
jgi:hypothetical protein